MIIINEVKNELSSIVEMYIQKNLSSLIMNKSFQLYAVQTMLCTFHIIETPNGSTYIDLNTGHIYINLSTIYDFLIKMNKTVDMKNIKSYKPQIEQCVIFLMLHEVVSHVFISPKFDRKAIDANYEKDILLNICEDLLGNLLLYNQIQEIKKNPSTNNIDRNMCSFDMKKFGIMLEMELDAYGIYALYNFFITNGNYKEKFYAANDPSIPAVIKTAFPGCGVMVVEFSYKNTVYKDIKIIKPKDSSRDGESGDGESGSGESGNGGENDAPQNSIENEIANANQLSKNALASAINSEGIGTLPLALRRIYQSILNIYVPWDSILRKCIAQYVDSKDSLNWAIPRMTTMLHDNYFHSPGLFREEKYSTLCIVHDESGSISDEDNRKFMSVVLQACSYFEFLEVIKHDTKIHFYKRYKCSEIANTPAIMEEILTRYCNGGTSHTKAFEKIKEISEDSSVKISCMIVLSDMESNIDESINIVPKNIPIVFVVPFQYTGKYHKFPNHNTELVPLKNKE